MREQLFKRLPKESRVAELARRLGSTPVPVREPLLIVASLALALVLLGGLSWTWALTTIVCATAWAIAVIYRQAFASSADGAAREADTATRTAASLAGMQLPVLLAGLPDAAIVLDATHEVVAANDAARALFPIATGRHISLITRAPDLLAAVDAAINRNEARSLLVRLTPPHERTLATRLTPLARSVRTIEPAVLIVLRDMTEQEQLSRMRADFVANASHELRTPLASLRGFVETLQGAAKDDPKARERFLGIMQEQAARMSRLIEDLLSLSRIEMREHVAPNETLDLSVVVDEVLKTLRPMADGAGITIAADRPLRLDMVIGDRDELAQVLQNLVQNAIKYGRRGGRIEVTLTTEGARLSLAVRDDGIGIAPEHLPRLTERFYRVNAKESREQGGTGLGLAIVKHIVSRHRGELRITSELGKGSTFAVSLPTKAV